MPDESYARSRLRQELARVRDRAGLSTRKLAPLLGVTYGTVNRDEHGPTLPSIPRVRSWLDVCAVKGDERERILELAEHARAETRPWSELLGGPINPQEEIRRREQEAVQVRAWQPDVFPGVLQTRKYALAVLEQTWTEDVDAAVTARLRRQADLYSSTVPRHFVIAERVWRAPWAPTEIAQAQRALVRELAELDAVTVGVVPETVLTVPAWQNFTMFTAPDGAIAVVRELTEGMSWSDGEEFVARHETVWARLETAAADPTMFP